MLDLCLFMYQSRKCLSAFCTKTGATNLSSFTNKIIGLIRFLTYILRKQLSQVSARLIYKFKLFLKELIRYLKCKFWRRVRQLNASVLNRYGGFGHLQISNLGVTLIPNLHQNGTNPAATVRSVLWRALPVRLVIFVSSSHLLFHKKKKFLCWNTYLYY